MSTTTNTPKSFADELRTYAPNVTQMCVTTLESTYGHCTGFCAGLDIFARLLQQNTLMPQIPAFGEPWKSLYHDILSEVQANGMSFRDALNKVLKAKYKLCFEINEAIMARKDETERIAKNTHGKSLSDYQAQLLLLGYDLKLNLCGMHVEVNGHPMTDYDDSEIRMRMEDSGYIARVAFVMDKILRSLGLSGRSIVPMLIGFGCTVPAVMSTRTLPSERDRRMTILLTPFFSCTAKLPIYGFFIHVFFPKYSWLIIMGLYVLGILVGVLVALGFKRTIFKGEPVPFVMELPNYRIPSPRTTLQLLWEKSKDFLQRAFSVILIATIVVWFLSNFDFRLNLVTDSHDSILAAVSGLLVPLFKPLGLGDWRVITSLISGFMAKESVVSVMQVIFPTEEAMMQIVTPLAAASMLVFSLLYTPCVAAVAAIKRELGSSWAVSVVVWQCFVAWVMAFIVRLIGTIF